MASLAHFFSRLLIATLLIAGCAAVLLFVALQRGIEIDAFSLGGVSIERLTLRLEDQLTLDVDRLTVATSAQEKQDPTELAPELARELLDGARWLARLFERIDLHQISWNALSGTFSYHSDNPGSLHLSSADSTIDLALRTDADQLLIDIEQLQLLGTGIIASGSLQIDTRERTLQADLDGVVAELLPVQLEVSADRDAMTFSGRGLDGVTTIRPIVELLRLSPAIEVWIAEYLHGHEFDLETVSGSIPYDDPAALLQNLHALVQVRQVAYRFAQGLAPILAERASVEFSAGVLHIVPEHATFYGLDGGQSYVDINFNDERAVLTAYLRSTTEVSRAVSAILDYYGLPFPIEQLAGQTTIDLTLTIDLATIDISTRGHFVAEGGTFALVGIPFEVPTLDVALKDTEVTLNRVALSKDGQFHGVVSGLFDAADARVELDIALHDVQMPMDQQTLQLLAPAGEPLVMVFNQDRNGTHIAMPASRWRYGQNRFAVGAFKTPLHELATLSGTLSAVDVAVGDWLRVRISGDYRLAPPLTSRLQIVPRSLWTEKLQLGKMRPPLSVQTDQNELQIANAAPLDVIINGLQTQLQPSRLRYSGGILHLNGGLRIGAGWTTGVVGQVNVDAGRGDISLQDLRIRGPADYQLLRGPDRLALKLAPSEDGSRLTIDQLGLSMTVSNTGGWRLDCPDTRLLARYSPLMQHQWLDQGAFSVESPAESTKYHFSGHLDYPYALLVEGNTPVNRYAFTGSYDGFQTRLRINDTLAIDLGRSVQIKSRGVGYNLAALGELINSLDKTPQPATDEEPPPLTIRLFARDAFIWLNEEHHLLADNLLVHFADNLAEVDLQHRSGYAELELDANNFRFIGRRFTDQFVNNLTTDFANFKGGTFDFEGSGTLDKFNAIIQINNTVLKDYKQLNNMLAFINTVPGLMTFNPPQYDQQGLPAKQIELGMKYNERHIDFEPLLIDSTELTIRGEGFIDLNEQITDMTFNLIYGAKKSIARIPLLGYILTGGEKKPSITLQVSGDLNDPEVSNTAFKEVATYPLQVIKRTILLPKHMINKTQQKSAQP